MQIVTEMLNTIIGVVRLSGMLTLDRATSSLIISHRICSHSFIYDLYLGQYTMIGREDAGAFGSNNTTDMQTFTVCRASHEARGLTRLDSHSPPTSLVCMSTRDPSISSLILSILKE